MELRAKPPGGPLEQKWERHRSEIKLVNPANRRKHEIIIVGTGLAGSSAAAALGETGEVTGLDDGQLARIDVFVQRVLDLLRCQRSDPGVEIRAPGETAA